jgi:hypothetical protein
VTGKLRVGCTVVEEVLGGEGTLEGGEKVLSGDTVA